MQSKREYHVSELVKARLSGEWLQAEIWDKRPREDGTTEYLIHISGTALEGSWLTSDQLRAL